MRNRPSRAHLSSLLTVSILCAGLATAVPPVGAGAATPPTPPVPAGKDRPAIDAPVHPGASTGSNDAAGAAPAATAGAVTEASLARSIEGTSARTTVEVVTSTPTADAQLQAIGATAMSTIGGITLASLTPSQIRALAAQAGVSAIRTPVEITSSQLSLPSPERGPVSSENLLSQDWINAGYDGRGVKVGIIDLFDLNTLGAQVTSGEVPPIYPAQRACFWNGVVCPFGTPGYTHGNSVAEVLADGAPGATFYLVEVGTINDYRAAIDWLASNGVTIVNHSAGGPYDGAGDGTGAAGAVIDYAVSKGIAWFNAAGNANKDPQYSTFQGGYWRGVWTDTDNDRWLNFSGTDESLTSYCGALHGLRWSDWAGARTDYDLYVSDYKASTRTNGTKVLASGYNQGTGSSVPLEGNDMRWLCNTDPGDGPVYDTNKDGFVSLWVYRTTRGTASPVGDVLEIMVNGGWFEHSSSAGSAGGPFSDSKNKGMASIGARVNLWYDLAGFSSRGPTNDGRFKPDLAVIGCLRTSLDGESQGCSADGFGGTSAASPVAAAIAALGAGAFGLTKPADIVSWMRSIASPTMGPGPKNNDEGWGLPNLFSVPSPAQTGVRYTPLPATRVLDTRGVNGVARGAGIGVRAADTITTISTPYVQGTTLALNVALVNAVSPGFLQVYPTGLAAPGATSNINVATVGGIRANFVLVATGVQGQISFYSSGGGHIIADFVGMFSASSPYPYITLAPYSTYETPSGPPQAGGSYVDVPIAGTTASFDANVGVPDITDNDDRPTGAAIAVTVSSPSGRGFLSVVAPDVSEYATSNINFEQGESITATTFVPLDEATGGMARIYVSKSARVRVDVLGYFTQGNHGSQGLFSGTNPTRVLDSRSGTKPVAGATIDVALATMLHVPADLLGAVFVNTTSSNSTGTGFVTSGATANDERYRTTTIPVAGQNIAASTVAQLTPSAALRVHTSVSSHLIADVAGWFTGPSAPVPQAAVTPVASALPLNTAMKAVGVSDDGSVVAFALYDITASSEYGIVHVWRASTGTAVAVTANIAVDDVAVSGDGSTVFITSRDPLLPADTDTITDVYSYRVSDGLLTLESVGEGGMQVEGVTFGGVSDDATRVAFISTTRATSTDLDDQADLFIRTRSTGAVTNASAGVPAPYIVYSGIINGPGTKAFMYERYLNQNSSYQRLQTTVDLSTGTATTMDHTIYIPQGDTIVDLSDNGQVALVEDSGRTQLVNTTTGDVTNMGITPPYRFSNVPTNGVLDGAGTHLVGVGTYLRALGMVNAPQNDVPLFLNVALTQPRAKNLGRTPAGIEATNAAGKMVLSDDGNHAVIFTWSTDYAPGAGSHGNIYVLDLTQF